MLQLNIIVRTTFLIIASFSNKRREPNDQLFLTLTTFLYMNVVIKCE